MLGWVLTRVAGAPFPELFSREVWSRIGAEQDAPIMLDASGFPVVEGGICTTLRDLARFGLLCLEDGRLGGEQIVPAEWVARVRVSDSELIEAFRASTDADPIFAVASAPRSGNAVAKCFHESRSDNPGPNVSKVWKFMVGVHDGVTGCVKTNGSYCDVCT